jgi:hypothetical protein
MEYGVWGEASSIASLEVLQVRKRAINTAAGVE